MPDVKVVNESHPDNFAIKAEYCSSFWKRLKGLMFKPLLEPAEGILLVEKNSSIVSSSIHMLFMNFDIAVIWLDDSFKVVDAKIAKRWHPYYASNLPARYILETHPNHISEFKHGDQIIIENY